MKKRTKKTIKRMMKPAKDRVVSQQTWLPVFTGFYHSIFDCSDHSIESEFDLSESEYKEYYEDLYNAGISQNYFTEHLWEYVSFTEAFNEAAKSICYGILNVDHADIIIDIDFERLVSPRYYNFSTDSINCEIKYNQKKLKKYLENNLENFEKYIKERYTSRSGFISSYSNDISDWMDETNWYDHELGSILQFVIFNQYGCESDAEYDLYEVSSCYEDFYNYREINTEKMIEDFKNKVA